MMRHNFCRSDGRIVKLFLFSTLLGKSPLTSVYFATFEKKREVRSPLPPQSNFLVFGNIYTYYRNIMEIQFGRYYLDNYHYRSVSFSDAHLFSSVSTVYKFTNWLMQPLKS